MGYNTIILQTQQENEGLSIMASSKEDLTFILEQLSGLDSVKYRAMMGE